MKTLFALFLFLAFAAEAEPEDRWPEREVYSVLRAANQTSTLIKVKVFSPVVEDSGGYYLTGEASQEKSVRCLLPVDVDGNEWQAESVKLPKDQLRASVPANNQFLKNINLTQPSASEGRHPLYQFGNQVFIIRAIDPAEVVKPILDDLNQRVELESCAMDSLNDKLPVVFLHHSSPEVATRLLGLLDLKSGKINVISAAGDAGAIMWVGADKLCVLEQYRKGTDWRLYSVPLKRKIGSGNFFGSTAWIVHKDQLHVWFPNPASFRLSP